MNNAEIAKEIGIALVTVGRRLAFANKAKLFATYEQQIFDELIPAAMKAIKTALDDGDAETALEMLKGMGIMKDPKTAKSAVEIEDENELQNYLSNARVEKLNERNTIDADTSGLAGLIELTAEANPEIEAEPLLVSEP